MKKDKRQKALFEGSGSVEGTRLEAFLYLLMRDHLPVGDVSGVVNSITEDTSTFTNGWLAKYAKYLASRLTEGKHMTVEEMKKWIDEASYESLLEKWRFAPVGSPWFQGDVGSYYNEVMMRKRKEVGSDAHVAASKSIGWEK